LQYAKYACVDGEFWYLHVDGTTVKVTVYCIIWWNTKPYSWWKCNFSL